ncbi:MAG: hypothetical protein AAGA09_09305 [Pseudomonadota bacterium]
MKKDQLVPFIVDVKPAPGEVALHKGRGDNAKSIPLKDIKKDLKERLGELNEMFASKLNTLEQDFELSEISVSLGFSAKGKLAFIAEASGEVAFQVVLRRKE